MMKKILGFLLLLTFLVGCEGEKPKPMAYSPAEKEALLVVEGKDGDQNLANKIEVNYKGWKDLAAKGEETAKAEVAQWDEIRARVEAKKASLSYEESKQLLQKK